MPGFVSHVERALGSILVPGISGFVDGAGRPHPVRSSRCRAVGPGQDQPRSVVKSPARRYRHRAAGERARRRVVLFGASECGPACIKFAVDESRLVAGLILFGSLAKGNWAPDYPARVAGNANMTPGASSSSPNGGGPAGIDDLRAEPCLAIPRRGPQAGLLRARPPVPAASGPCSPRCDTDVKASPATGFCAYTLALHSRERLPCRWALAAGRDMARPNHWRAMLDAGVSVVCAPPEAVVIGIVLVDHLVGADE